MQESDFYKKFEHFLFGSLLHKISVYFFKLRRWDKIEGVKLFTGGGGFFAARRCACFPFYYHFHIIDIVFCIMYTKES